MELEIDEAPQAMTASYSAPNCTVRGSARGTMFRPANVPLWRIAGELLAGAEIEWATQHGDEAVYVVEGSLEADGRNVGAGAAVIIEAGVPAVVRALTDTTVLHFGPEAVDSPVDGLLGPAEETGRGVHVVTLDDAETITGPTDGPTNFYFSDGSCRTCRIAFFVVDGRDLPNGWKSPSHSHSQDEIVHVLDGTLQLGPAAVGENASFSLRGGHRYGFRASAPFRFLNYRRDVATSETGKISDPFVMIETVAEIRKFSREQIDSIC